MTKALDWALLFQEEAPRLIRRLRRFRDRIVPEDVVQSAFVKMLETDVSAVEDPRAYLARLARNLALDELRRQKRARTICVREDALDRLVAEAAQTPEQAIIEAERFTHVTAAFRALPRKERLALIMFRSKGLSHQEIGERLGVSRHSVPRYLSRALAKCAEAIEAFERAGQTEKNDDGPNGQEDRTRGRRLGGQVRRR